MELSWVNSINFQLCSKIVPRKYDSLWSTYMKTSSLNHINFKEKSVQNRMGGGVRGHRRHKWWWRKTNKQTNT